MAEKTVWTGGERGCGFEVKIDRKRRILRFAFSGFWDIELGVAYREACLTAMKQLSKTGPWCVLADISKYPAQKPEVQKCHADTMIAGPKLGMRRAANLVDNTLSQMQIRRLSQESGIPAFSFFQSEAEAVAWLEESLAAE